MSMKQHVDKLLQLVEVTNVAAFPKTPRGYQQRERASLLQLCLHPNPIVREAAAQSVLLRDMFVVAMYEAETDESIKSLLEVRYRSALSKEQQRESEVDSLKSRVEDLLAQLKSKKKKK